MRGFGPALAAASAAAFSTADCAATLTTAIALTGNRSPDPQADALVGVAAIAATCSATGIATRKATVTAAFSTAA